MLGWILPFWGSLLPPNHVFCVIFGHRGVQKVDFKKSQLLSSWHSHGWLFWATEVVEPILESSDNVFFGNNEEKYHFPQKMVTLVPNVSIGCCSDHLHAGPTLTIFDIIFDTFHSCIFKSTANDITYLKTRTMFTPKIENFAKFVQKWLKNWIFPLKTL